MKPDLDHLSYSSINSYLMCGANWKFHYLDKIKTPTSPELLFGSAFHGAVEDFLTEQAAAIMGKFEDPRPLVDCWSTAWNKQVEAQGKDVDWGLETPEMFFNTGIRLLTTPEIVSGIQSINPKIREDETPAIETKIELKVPGVPIPVIGFIDIITTDGVPGDFKTSSRAWSADKANGETQPLFYLAAMNQAGMETPDWRFRHYVVTKTKTPTFTVHEHTHNPAQLMWLFKMIQNVWKGIEAGVFPENPGSWKCSPTWCEYWMLCRGKYGG